MSKNRFEFGRNWAAYVSTLNDERIAGAEDALVSKLETSLVGRTFLDIGSGSGLMSLVARRQGAVVHSFDYDSQSVACTSELKSRFYEGDLSWHVERGDVLDRAYIQNLGRFDVVYSWGVLHHTGDMWQALSNVDDLVADGGTLFIAIYNDQGWESRFWLAIKKLYNRMPPVMQRLMAGLIVVRFWARTVLIDASRGSPLKSWRSYVHDRGMSPWHDAIDWVGGYPFEVAKPEEVFDFYRRRGYILKRLKTCAGGTGCNEFIFHKSG